MIFGSLFSGIGGIDLGLERAGMRCAWQIEINRECHKELNKHWPEVPKFYDVRAFKQYDLRPVDLVAGGFPCQPHSVAGERKGEDDERNLWPDFFRVVQALRPRWVLAENVPGIRTTIADSVLADLEAEGYACWPFVVGAWAVGAPHRRDRVWFVAYDTVERRPSEAPEEWQSQSQRHSDLADRHRPRQYQSKRIVREERRRPENSGNGMADALRSNGGRRQETGGLEFRSEELANSAGGSQSRLPVRTAAQIPDIGVRCQDGELADAKHGRCAGRDQERRRSDSTMPSIVADSDQARSPQHARLAENDGAEFSTAVGANRLWPTMPGEPQHKWEEARTNLPYDLLGVWDRVRSYYPQALRTAQEERQTEKAFGLPVGAMGRAINGLSGRLLRRYIGQLKRNRIHALGGLGNAVVPDVVEAIGRAIMEADRSLNE